MLRRPADRHPAAITELEVIGKGQTTAEHPRPLLFVHGGWHAAWCWDAHFLDYFAARGYKAVALSLRAHGGSPSPKGLQRCTIDDYVKDLRTVAGSMSDPPVLVGHSMGGFIIQKYLERWDAAAAILMATVPVRGTRRSSMAALRRHPWLSLRSLLTLNSLCLLQTRELARETLFAADTPDDLIDTYLKRLQNESTLAISVDMAFRRLPKPQLVNAPVMVLAGGRDTSMTTAEVYATALAYGTAAQFVPGIGHEMMLEPEWEAAASRIDAWLRSQGL